MEQVKQEVYKGALAPYVYYDLLALRVKWTSLSNTDVRVRRPTLRGEI
jgi:hypothetical protein